MKSVDWRFLVKVTIALLFDELCDCLHVSG